MSQQSRLHRGSEKTCPLVTLETRHESANLPESKNFSEQIEQVRKNVADEQIKREASSASSKNKLYSAELIQAGKALYDGMHNGLWHVTGAPDSAVDVLRNLDFEQRKELVKYYKETYDKDLIRELSKGLTSNKRLEMLALFQGKDARADALALTHELRKDRPDSEKVFDIINRCKPELHCEFSAEVHSITGRSVATYLDDKLPRRDAEIAIAYFEGRGTEAKNLEINRVSQSRRPTIDALEAAIARQPNQDNSATSVSASEAKIENSDRLKNSRFKGINAELAEALTKGEVAKAAGINFQLLITGKKSTRAEAISIIESLSPENKKAADIFVQKRFGSSIAEFGELQVPGAESKHLTALMDGRNISDGEKLSYLLNYKNTPDQKIEAILADKTSVQLSEIRSDFGKHDSMGLDARADKALSGRSKFTVKQLLKGLPETLEEKLQVAEEQRKFDRKGLGGWVVRNFSRKEELISLDKIKDAISEAKSDGKIDEAEKAKIDELFGIQKSKRDSYIDKVREPVDDTIATAATTGAAAAITAATAGIATPIALSTVAGIGVRPLVHRIASGPAYNRHQIRRDMALGGIQAATTAAVSVGVRELAHAISETESSANQPLQRLARTAIDGVTRGGKATGKN